MARSMTPFSPSNRSSTYEFGLNKQSLERPQQLRKRLYSLHFQSLNILWNIPWETRSDSEGNSL